jgi:hypothetical protein
MKKLSIYLMFAVAGLFMAACGPEDNEFAKVEKAGADTNLAVPYLFASEVNLVDLNAIEISEEQDVQIFTVSDAEMPEGLTLSKAEIVFDDGVVLPATADGKVSGEALTEYVSSIHGMRPEARTVTGNVYLYATNNGGAVKVYAGKINFQVVPKAPVIAEKYYLTGTMNGWDNTNTTYELGNGGQDPYANPTFTCSIKLAEIGNPTSIEFKATPVDGLGGDWSGCLAAGEEGKFNYKNVGGNFKIDNIKPETKVIRLTFNMLDQTWSYQEVAFDQFIYFIGATDGWASPDQKLELTDESGIYTGYVYCADPNGWGVEFKFQKIPGDWGDNSQLNSNNITAVTGDFEKTNDNFKAAGGVGVYYVTIDLANQTINGLKVEKMGIIGDFNGWGGDVEMTWNAADFCYEATDAGVNANGWKFRVNADWGINLGSNDSVEPSTKLDDLVANGKNIGVAGNTIKLYPTRKTSDKIYCTVE